MSKLKTIAMTITMICSGCIHVPLREAHPPALPPLPPDLPYSSSLTATSYGRVRIEGEVWRADDGECCFSATKSSVADAKELMLSDDRTGSEDKKCGGDEYWQRSKSFARSSYTEQSDLVK